VVARQPDDLLQGERPRSPFVHLVGAGGWRDATVGDRFDDPSRRSPGRESATEEQRSYFTIAPDESDIWTMEILKE
jgi:hypothetical protein